MDVDEPGRDEPALGVELAPAAALDGADGRDAVAVDGDVGPPGAEPVPSATSPPRITMSCMPSSSPARAPAASL